MAFRGREPVSPRRGCIRADHFGSPQGTLGSQCRGSVFLRCNKSSNCWVPADCIQPTLFGLQHASQREASYGSFNRVSTYMLKQMYRRTLSTQRRHEW